MRSKNISTQSSKQLTYFNGIAKPCFKSSEAFEILSESSKPVVNQLLIDVINRDLLMRIKDGVYYIISYKKNLESLIPDWHLLTKNFVNGNNNYIGYYSALQIHNLIIQPSFKQQIVVANLLQRLKTILKKLIFTYLYAITQDLLGKNKKLHKIFQKYNIYKIDLDLYIS